jgi:hypothetical protein
VQIKGRNFDFDEKVLTYPEMHEPVIEFYGRPLGVLNRKLNSMKTSGGNPVRLLALFSYTGRAWAQHYDTDYWIEAAKKFKFPYLNLIPEMNAMHLSYFPVTSDETHFNPDGSSFFGKLLAHELIKDKIIPWDEDPTPLNNYQITYTP